MDSALEYTTHMKMHFLKIRARKPHGFYSKKYGMLKRLFFTNPTSKLFF